MKPLLAAIRRKDLMAVAIVSFIMVPVFFVTKLYWHSGIFALITIVFALKAWPVAAVPDAKTDVAGSTDPNA